MLRLLNPVMGFEQVIRMLTSVKGGAYAYGASKAGLNYVIKSFAGDVPEVIFGM